VRRSIAREVRRGHLEPVFGTWIPGAPVLTASQHELRGRSGAGEPPVLAVPVYYHTVKWDLNRRLIYEGGCDERLIKAKLRDLLVSYTSHIHRRLRHRKDFYQFAGQGSSSHSQYKKWCQITFFQMWKNVLSGFPSESNFESWSRDHAKLWSRLCFDITFCTGSGRRTPTLQIVNNLSVP
jgi:hypothetical protein